MKYEHVLELIKTVSESKLTFFQYEEGETKICMKAGQKATAYQEVKMQDGILPHEENAVIQTMVEGKNIVVSPLVGTYYAAPSEEAEPFVQVGDTVKKGQVLAIVEAMKLMNEIESDYDGVIAEVLVDNGQGVEYGQPLFVIQ